MTQRIGHGLNAAFLLLLLVGFTAAPAHAAQVNIAAIVGDDVITTTDVAERRDLIMATANIPMTVENQQKITPRIVQSLVDEALELQEAKAQSQTVTDDEVNKAIDTMSAHGEDKENLRAFISEHHLSMRSLQNQIKAQLAWNKVVSHKLRRNVSVAQDEVLRAQKAAAAAPGEPELRIQAIDIRFNDQPSEVAARKLADEIGLELKSGTPMDTLAARYLRQPQVVYDPPVWLPEKNLPAGLQQGLRSMKTGDITPPIGTQKSIQFLQLLDRATSSKQADATEYALKQITVPLPAKHDKPTLAKLHATVTQLHDNPGSCDEQTLPATSIPAEAKIIRAKLAVMSPQQRELLSHMDVGDVSSPLMGADAVRLVMLCEKVEPAAGNLPDAEATRQQLFNEKLELEAQKHLRNLRRDAYIDIKGSDSAAK